MQISQILSYTDSLLHPNEYKDYAPNGLQAQGDGREIRKIALAVTASLAAEKEAVRIGADALFVHHGCTTMRALSEFDTPVLPRF